jgi:large subunit ribosomal protein L18
MTITKYGKTRHVPHRRKREGKTNYKKRLQLLKAAQMRLVIRKSLNTVIAQLVEYNQNGDKVLLAVTSKELSKIGWKAHKGNMPSAYLTGLLLGVKAKKKKITSAIIDIGLLRINRGGRVFAAIKGVIDAGVNVDCDKSILPNEERITGKHIAQYAQKLKNEKQKYDKQFSKYIKQGVAPEKMCELFEEAKKKVLAS